MKNWLERVSLDLLELDSLPPKEKLFSALTILCCLYILRHDKSVCSVKEDVQICLLRLIALSSDGALHYQYLRGEMYQNNSQLVVTYANATCMQLTLVSYMYSINFRELIVKSLTHMFVAVAERKVARHTIHLLRALPLIHFIREDSIPNVAQLLRLPQVVFNDLHLNFGTVYNTMDHSKTG